MQGRLTCWSLEELGGLLVTSLSTAMSPGVLFFSFLEGSPRRGGSSRDFSSGGGIPPAAAAELLPGGVAQGGAAAARGGRGGGGGALPYLLPFNPCKMYKTIMKSMKNA